MTGNRRPILIDTDTASDDAVALIMALRSPLVDVKAITAVAGNVGVEQAARNALYTVELCGTEVPVYRGAAAPLARKLETADWFHGADGMGDHGYSPARKEASPTHAVEAILDTVRQYPGLEIITLGPLTNLALAIEEQPSLAQRIGRCVVMGGAPCCEGNVTPAAEFNLWVDPEAARIVFHSGLNIEMIGWQLSRWDAVLREDEMQQVLALGTRLAEFAIECNSKAIEGYRAQTGEQGMSLPDAVAMAVMLQPEVCLESSRHLVEVETASELTRGMTVVDRLHVARDARNSKTWASAIQRGAPVQVCWKLDVAAWKRMLFASLR
jgi:purine nucleosidase